MAVDLSSEMFSASDIESLREESFQKSAVFVFHHLRRRMIDFQEDNVRIRARLACKTGETMSLALYPKKKVQDVVFSQTQWCRVEDILASKGLVTRIEENHILVTRTPLSTASTAVDESSAPQKVKS